MIDTKMSLFVNIDYLLARLLERMKDTGHYTRNLLHPSHEPMIKIESDINGHHEIPATQNLLTNENHHSI